MTNNNYKYIQTRVPHDVYIDLLMIQKSNQSQFKSLRDLVNYILTSYTKGETKNGKS